MKTSGRRRRALVLLPTVPIMAVGTALIFAVPAAAQTTGYLEVCKSGSNGFTGQTVHFSVDGGAPIAVVGGQCSAPMQVTAGSHTITEAATTPPSYIQFFTVSGGGQRVSRHGRTVTVKVDAGSLSNEAMVTFYNKYPAAFLKVCKQADANSPSLVGTDFSFNITNQSLQTVSAGAFGSPNCTGAFQYTPGTNVNIAEQPVANTHVSAISVVGAGAPGVTNPAAGTTSLKVPSGVTVVTYTNAVNPIRSTGYIEVCKEASGPYVSGQFSFNITDSSGVPVNRNVWVGQCSDPLQVLAGNVTVSEVPQAGFAVENIQVTSANGSLVSSNPTNGTAVVNVPASTNMNDEAQVTFWNQAQTAYLKVCKTLTATSGALAGHVFEFDISGATDSTVYVTAGAAGTTQCKQSPYALPVGSNVTVQEVAQPDVQVVGQNPQTIQVLGGINTVSFTNQAMGYVEVCKTIQDSRTLTGMAPTFGFTINPSSGPSISQSVQAGLNGLVRCSGPIQVPAGPATVSEGSVANYHLASTAINGMATSPNPSNPVSVNVVFGPASTSEQSVLFTNAVNTATLKVCKTVTDPSLARSFWFGVSGNVNLPASFSLTPGAGNNYTDCAAAYPQVPVLGTDLQPTTFTVTEQDSTVLPYSLLQSISVNPGGGSIVNSIIPGGAGQGGSATVSLSGAPTTVVTFTNGLYISTPGA